MKIIIGVDDTDNKRSRGTGFRAREMGRLLLEQDLAIVENITRHQLLVHKKIPYTSHNSCASIVCTTLMDLDKITGFCRKYLKKNSARFSDAGLCIAEWELASEEVVQWGQSAKIQILKKSNARKIASVNNIFLEGLTGWRTGIIGALAAVGLRKGGNDGRVLWLEELREKQGIFSVNELYRSWKIDKIATIKKQSLPGNALIFINEWCRPVVINQEITILAEEVNNNEQYGWRNVSKEYIRKISE